MSIKYLTEAHLRTSEHLAMQGLLILLCGTLMQTLKTTLLRCVDTAECHACMNGEDFVLFSVASQYPFMLNSCP